MVFGILFHILRDTCTSEFLLMDSGNQLNIIVVGHHTLVQGRPSHGSHTQPDMSIFAHTE